MKLFTDNPLMDAVERSARSHRPGMTRIDRRTFVRDGFGLLALTGVVGAGMYAAPSTALAASAAGDAGSSADGDAKGAASSAYDGERLKVYASFYATYDFAKKVGGDRVDVTCLVPAGTEPHDWEPATTDVRNIEEGDVLVYNGADMEHWVEKLLASLQSTRLVTIEASKGVKLRTATEEHAEDGSEQKVSQDASGASEGGHDDDHDHDHETDPHVWLSPANAKAELANVRDGLVQADPDGKAVYDANYEKWAAEFDKLDQEFAEKLGAAPKKDIVVSHQAFGYLCDEFGLTQVPIEGLDAEGEPDARTLAQITDFVKKNDVKVIFSEELVSPKLAQTIADATGAEMAELNPLEGLTDEELAAGEDYLSVMRANLDELVKALS